MNKSLKFSAVIIILLFVAMVNAHAAGTSSSSWGMEKRKDTRTVWLYDQGVEASKNNNFQGALALFKQALQNDMNNPDILNMLAHTQLKLGMIDEALEGYKKALILRPNFPEAREYLGEAYIQAAMREIKILKGYGSEGAENLEDLTRVFKDASAGL